MHPGPTNHQAKEKNSLKKKIEKYRTDTIRSTQGEEEGEY